MRKLSLVLCLFLLISMIFNAGVFAYSSNEFTIDIPDSYVEKSTDSFTDEEGRNVNVKISSYTTFSEGEIYSEKNLQEIADGLTEGMDEMKAEVKESLLNNGSGLTEEQIDAYVETFKIESFLHKEIITDFSKNNYKAFHITEQYQMGERHPVVDQYMVVGETKTYTLTVTSLSLDEYNSNANQNIIDSFTIVNFKPVQEGNAESNSTNTVAAAPTSSTSNKLVSRLIVTGIVVVVGGLLSLLRKKRR